MTTRAGGNDAEFRVVLELLTRVPKPPEAGLPAGASLEQIKALERRIELPVPPALRRWLMVCNGYMAGPGGLFGSRPGDRVLDVGAAMELWPEWHALGWIPVAGDGCGDAYVLDTASGAVFFIDCHEDPGLVAYAVASTLSRFLVFLLENELGERRWPFDGAFVLAQDPELGSVADGYLPWRQP